MRRTCRYELTERAVPSIIFRLTANDDLASSAILANLSAFSAALGFIFNPVLGGLSDRFGRKPVLLMYPAFKAVSTALLVLQPSRATLFLNGFARLFMDVTFTASNAVISDVVDGDGRSVASGNLNFWRGVAQLIAAPISGFLTTRDVSLSLSAGAGAALVYLLSLLVRPTALAEAWAALV